MCDMNCQVLNVSSVHMFRHFSEVKNQRKGGYLEGKIAIPDKQNFQIELSLKPPVDKVRGKDLKVHPDLLHLAILKKTRAKRKRKKVDPDEDDTDENETEAKEEEKQITKENWRIVLEKKGDKVFYHNPATQKLVEINCLERDTKTGELCLILGRPKELLLTILYPLQGRNQGVGIPLEEVLQDIFFRRKTLCENWEFDELKELYLGKEKLVSLNEVYLKIRILSKTGDDWVTASECTSPQKIISSKHKSTVPIATDKVYGSGTCCRVDSLHLITLKNQIQNKDVRAELVLMTQNDQISKKDEDLLKALNPPKKSKVLHGINVEVVVPAQDANLISNILQRGHKIGVVLSRPENESFKSNPVRIPVFIHNREHCCWCEVANKEVNNNENHPYNNLVPFSPDSAYDSECKSEAYSPKSYQGSPEHDSFLSQTSAHHIETVLVPVEDMSNIDLLGESFTFTDASPVEQSNFNEQDMTALMDDPNFARLVELNSNSMDTQQNHLSTDLTEILRSNGIEFQIDSAERKSIKARRESEPKRNQVKTKTVGKQSTDWSKYFMILPVAVALFAVVTFVMFRSSSSYL